jgi:succinate dehydrogenase/fumarate reductase flavoprotein subunit
VTTTAQPWLPAKWDYTADVVVVGYGGAGAVAALNAQKAGVKVLMLEKAPQAYAGGNTCVSGGNIFTPSPAADAVTYLNAMAGPYPIPQDMVQTWAQQMIQNLTTLTGLGATAYQQDSSSELPSGYLTAPTSFLPEFSQLPGSDCAHEICCGAAPGRGVDYFNEVARLVQAAGIQVLYQTPATGLVQNPQTSEILGVIATTATGGTATNPGTNSGTPIYVKASKAVILTLGGYENNPQMLRDFCQLANGGPHGTPYNTGDGIPMVQQVGAALWHMDNISGSGLGFQPTPTSPFFGLSMPAAGGFIYIGADGARFVNESVSSHHGKIPFNYVANPTITANTTWIPFPTPFSIHVIFDDTTRKAGPITPLPNASSLGWNVVRGIYTWSSDNSVEISNGWIKTADTLQDLAPLINRDPTQLSSVVAQYNSYCAAGVDSQFGRPKTALIAIQTPPYYAVSLQYHMFNTQGGAKRNTKAQVVDANNSPIPRLYSAGEFGSIYSWEYNGGGNLGETVAFGTIAGKAAAQETSWG